MSLWHMIQWDEDGQAWRDALGCEFRRNSDDVAVSARSQRRLCNADSVFRSR